MMTEKCFHFVQRMSIGLAANWYLYEPCKILISEVTIIDKENVFYDKKSKSYLIKVNPIRYKINVFNVIIPDRLQCVI